MPRTAIDRAPSFLQEVGFRLACTRKALRLSQTQAADRMGVKRAAWNNYEKGRRLFDIEVAIRFCEVHRISLDWFYRGDMGSLTVKLADRMHEEMTVGATHDQDLKQ